MILNSSNIAQCLEYAERMLAEGNVQASLDMCDQINHFILEEKKNGKPPNKLNALDVTFKRFVMKLNSTMVQTIRQKKRENH